MSEIALLIDCVQKEIGLIAECADLLKKEYHSLSQDTEAEALEALTSKKNDLLQQLSALGESRNTLLAQLKFDHGHEGMRQAIKAYPELSEYWQKLEADVKQIDQLNNENGALIKIQLQDTRDTLNFLRSLIVSTQTYGTSGRQSPASLIEPIIAS